MLSLSINGLGVARVLGREGVPVIGVSRDDREPGLASRYVRDVWRYEGGDRDLVDLLLSRAGKLPDRPVLYPITDGMVRAISARRDELLPHYRLALPDHETLERAMSKRGFARLAAEAGLPLPQSFHASSEADVRRIAEEVTFPCIVKPDFQSPPGGSRGGLKTARADDPSSLLAGYHSFSDCEPSAVIQEWVDGGDANVLFCLQYYSQQRRPVASFCGRKIRQWPPLTGSTASCEPSADRDVEELTTRFFTATGFRGLCSMEYKRDPRTGRLVTVEPTVGRTDWQSDVANANGVPLPYIAYRDLLGVPLPDVRPRRGGRRWVRWSADRASAQHYRREGTLSWAKWLASIRPPIRWAVWSWRDPWPYLSRAWWQWKRRVEKLRQKAARTLTRSPRQSQRSG
ncbi:MAG: hypothetical protein ACOC93_00890 [Planctomycetota bacterium]